jgi:hypothetical protein
VSLAQNATKSQKMALRLIEQRTLHIRIHPQHTIRHICRSHHPRTSRDFLNPSSQGSNQR